MPKKNTVAMTQARFAAIVDTYGSVPSRWPSSEREDAESWLATNLSAQELVSLAHGLDQAMGVPEIAAPSSALESRLLVDFDRAARSWSWRKLVRAAAETIWPGAPPWQPACALGVAFAIGLSVAVFAPLDVAQPIDTASGTFALDAAPDADAGQGI